MKKRPETPTLAAPAVEVARSYLVLGMRFQGAENLAANLKHEDPIRLVREPGNKFDPNAIAVWAIDPSLGREKKLGYVSKTQNALLAQFIDQQGKLWREPHHEGAGMAADEMPIFRSIEAKANIKHPENSRSQLFVKVGG